MVAEAGVWEPSHVHYLGEAVVDTLLSVMLTDLKVTTPEEIDAAVGQSERDPGSRTLWVPETLEVEVRNRIKQT